MAEFGAILSALAEGKSVRRSEWEPMIQMFVTDDTLMCQCGNAKPWLYTMTWGEIAASDWQLVNDGSSNKKTSQKLAPSAPDLRSSAKGIADSMGEALDPVTPSSPLPFWLFSRRRDI